MSRSPDLSALLLVTPSRLDLHLFDRTKLSLVPTQSWLLLFSRLLPLLLPTQCGECGSRDGFLLPAPGD